MPALKHWFIFNYQLLYILLVLPASVFAQQEATAPVWKTAGGFSNDWANLSISITPLTASAYMLHGSGGNMLLSTGEDGILLVDNEFPEIYSLILESIASIQPGPIEYVLNTHFHGDHTGINTMLADQGAVIIAQERSRSRMTTEQVNLFFGSTTAPAPHSALPVITFKDSVNLHFNGEHIEFFFISAAHTDGDSIVYFPEANVVHMGDVYISDLYPIIDLAGGGNIDGYFPAIDAVLERINDDTAVLPGHGPVGTKKMLIAYRDMLQSLRDDIQALIEAGADIDTILAANVSKAFDQHWASDRVGPEDITMMIYLSLTGEYGMQD